MSDVERNSKLGLPEKPLATLEAEERIRDDLIAQGVDVEVAAAVVGYRHGDLPFIYGTAAHGVLHHRVPEEWWNGAQMLEGQSSLWIATTSAIHDLEAGSADTDQIREVIAQWWGNTFDGDPSLNEVTRLEVKHLPDGRFLQVEYTGVSAMGALDGRISRMGLYVPEGRFRPYGTNPLRTEYRIYDLRDQDGAWRLKDTSNATGTTILNGYQQLLTFHLSDYFAVKEDLASAYRFDPVVLQEVPAIATAEAPNAERVETVAKAAREVVESVAPYVLAILARGGYEREARSMVLNGVLRHPDKIDLLNTTLASFSNEQRFAIARHISVIIDEGHLVAWAKALQQERAQELRAALVDRCNNQLLRWLIEKAPTHIDLPTWLDTAKLFMAGTVGHSSSYEQIFNGLATTCVELMIQAACSSYLNAHDEPRQLGV